MSRTCGTDGWGGVGQAVPQMFQVGDSFTLTASVRCFVKMMYVDTRATATTVVRIEREVRQGDGAACLSISSLWEPRVTSFA